MDQQTIRGQGRAIVAGIAGNVMEWYDFSVYGYFAAIIGRNFFPTGDRTTSLIAAFGVFAAGFFMRPLGSILFGYIGDKKGRKLALTISVGLMAVPTFLIGVLPTYQQIGLWGSLSLVLLRLLQGLSVGGEFTTSAIFLVEGSAARRRGFLGSFAPLGASAGTLLGSAVGAAVTTLLGQSAIESWGWRVPFLIGILVGVVGLYIRSGLAEDRLAQPKTKSPIREAFQTEWRTILRLIGLNAAFAVSFYMGFVYITTYIRQVDHIAQSTALDINTVAMLVSLILIPLIGVLSDRIGRKPILLAATGGLFVLAWPLFWMLHHPEIALVLPAQIGFAVLVACFGGTVPAAMVELVPDRVRCTVLSVGYNAGMAVLGGMTPVVAVYTIQRSQYDLSPAFLLMAAAGLSLVTTVGLRETYQLALSSPAAITDAA
jgi:MHS family proline/betaine transporter-like MFS transporter